MEKEILTIIENSFPVPTGTITVDTPLESVIKDSMDFIELVAILSSKYKLNTQAHNFEKIRTVRDIATYIVETEQKDDSSQIKLHKF